MRIVLMGPPGAGMNCPVLYKGRHLR
jgi:hypothetical protein